MENDKNNEQGLSKEEEMKKKEEKKEEKRKKEEERKEEERKKEKERKEEDRLFHIHQSSASFHSILVQTRFAVAGLFMTASAFLVQAHFCNDDKEQVIFLGIFVTIACWMLELRTESLLKNIQVLGLNTEKKLDISKEIGFFHLMDDKQEYGIRIPFLCGKIGDDCRLSNKCFLVPYFFAQTFILNSIYFAFLIFWIFKYSAVQN